MNVPRDASARRYVIVCKSHGLLEDRPKDFPAAEIIQEEHHENCPADSEIVHPDEFQCFTDACELAEKSPEQVAVQQPQAVIEAGRGL